MFHLYEGIRTVTRVSVFPLEIMQNKFFDLDVVQKCKDVFSYVSWHEFLHVGCNLCGQSGSV